MTSLWTRADRLFRARYGRASDGVWSGPGRVNLIGEHTDYNDGFVLPFAIDRRTTATLALRDDGLLRVVSSYSPQVVEIGLADLAPARLAGWSAYPLGVAWALGQSGVDLSTVPGADISIDSTVPVGAGLSSSAAIESAVALALADVWDTGLGREALAQIGRLSENVAVGAPTGIMDQSASLLGRRDSAVFLDCRSLQSRIVPLRLGAADVEILVVDTGTAHAHAGGEYAARRRSCEAGARTLGVPSLRDLTRADLPRAERLLDEETFRRVRHVVTEDQRVLDTVRILDAEGPTGIGELLNASHRSMRDDFEISTALLDLAVETAQRHGAIGARMTGGGFGGAAIALVPRAFTSDLSAALDRAFTEHGHPAPQTFVVHPEDGARRESPDLGRASLGRA